MIPTSRADRLAFLIEHLSELPVPADEQERWNVVRGLMNVRAPGPLDDDVIEVQDALLRAETEAKGITRLSDVGQGQPGIRLWRGDITTLAVDAIVNAANSRMLGCFQPLHRCVDNAIHTYAGMQLRNECAVVMSGQAGPEPTGRAKLTCGYNLPARHVLHTVGPIVAGTLTDLHRTQLASCYSSCLQVARDAGLRSVAFCCISTGEFRFPQREAAMIAVRTVQDAQRDDAATPDVVFTVFTDTDERLYSDLLT